MKKTCIHFIYSKRQYYILTISEEIKRMHPYNYRQLLHQNIILIIILILKTEFKKIWIVVSEITLNTLYNII